MLVLGALGVGGLLLATSGGKKKRGTATRDPGDYDLEPGGGWAWKYAPEWILYLGGLIEDATGWINLPEFLLAVAWTESRGNPFACHGECKPNSARGLYQGRPKSFLVGDLEGYPSDLLFDIHWATALATWYIWRLRNWGFSGQTIDWLAVRRGFAYPRLVSDVNETAEVSGFDPGERSKDTRRRFENALAAVGLPDEFMYERAYPPGLGWPGIWNILEIVGAPSVEEAVA